MEEKPPSLIDYRNRRQPQIGAVVTPVWVDQNDMTPGTCVLLDRVKGLRPGLLPSEWIQVALLRIKNDLVQSPQAYIEYYVPHASLVRRTRYPVELDPAGRFRIRLGYLPRVVSAFGESQPGASLQRLPIMLLGVMSVFRSDHNRVNVHQAPLVEYRPGPEVPLGA